MKPKTLTYEYIRLWRSNDIYSYIYGLNVATTNLYKGYDINLEGMSDKEELNLAWLIYSYFKDNRELKQSLFKVMNILQEIKLMHESKCISLNVLKVLIKDDFEECWNFYKYFLKKNKNEVLRKMYIELDEFLTKEINK